MRGRGQSLALVAILSLTLVAGCITDGAQPAGDADAAGGADPHAGHGQDDAASAGPLVDDATGDASLAGAPWAAVEPWADLFSVSIINVDAESFTIEWTVAGTPLPLVDGVLLLHFTANGHAFFAGYGAVAPFESGHGFYCPSDGGGVPTGECPDVPGSAGAGTFAVTLPRADIGVEAPGSLIDETWAETGHHVAYRMWVPIDEAGPGGSYVFA